MKINWDKPITFRACKEGFSVEAIKLDKGYKIISAHFSYCVDENGIPLNSSLSGGFNVTNVLKVLESKNDKNDDV